jgi:hypothetical protein
MRGWTSMLVGFLLLAVAVWSFTADGLGSSALLCGAAAAFFFLRGAQGLGAGEAGDPTALVDFVTDPADAIVDAAADQVAEWMGSDNQKGTAGEQPRFDADAIIARYLAQREAEPAAPVPRAFGRKGL